jgi:ATP-binding cassette subfamily F protein 3
MPRPLLEVKDIKKSYGRQAVLNDLSFIVLEGQKIALIGRNGAGKSTLLNILTGKEEMDGGEVSLLPWTRVGMVAQHETLPSDVTTEEYLSVKSEKPSWEVRKLGAKFGLSGKELSQPPSTLSGGYQMRVKIVAMLLADPNLLLLDEPVNYLDLSTLLLLEKFLAEYDGSFIVTAHDREFLGNTCKHTYEIERGELTTYPGTVADYFEWKEEQRGFVLRTNKKVSREMAHHQKFVDRFRYKASQASRAQNKLKHIERLRHQIALVQKDLNTSTIIIPTPHFIPGTAVRAEKLTVGYGEKIIAADISFDWKRGEKIVIAGENGKGKSTLLKTLAGIIPPLEGDFKWWHRADIGYYDQKTDATLIPSETVLQYLTRMAPVNTPGERILMMAGNFLFRNDDLEKTTSILSGGERARLCLAGILLHEHNVLILDEPTNHLDVETAESLALALKEYGGTVLFVSHARTFVNALADQIYEIRGGTLRHYTGTYEEYVDDLAAIMDEIADTPQVTDSNDEKKRENRALLKEKQRLQERVNQGIVKLDKEKSTLLAYFFENPLDYSPEKSQRLNELTEEIEKEERIWLKLQDEIDKLR